VRRHLLALTDSTAAQSGQQSDTLDRIMYNFGYTYKDVRTIAAEIEKLAGTLP
jgi:hypothetical protein